MSDTTQDGRIMAIKVADFKQDYFLINRLSAAEAISTPFEFNVELYFDHGDDAGYDPNIVDPQKVLSKSASLAVKLPDETYRFFNGIVSRFSQGGRDERYSTYRMTIVPQFWLLTQKFQSRIFQQKSVPDILKKVLAGLDVSFEMQGTFEPRNYCVQYQETDFDFASRLMEEEGIFYYFKHTKDGKHTMTIANTPQSHTDCDSKSKIPFALKEKEESFTGSIATWLADYQVQTGKVTLWDTHFESTGKKLEAEKPARPDIHADSMLEHYEFPGSYARKFDGVDKSGGDQASELSKIFTENKKIAEIRMEEISAQYEIFSGISDCCTLTAGHRFNLEDHPNKEYNKNPYTIISVTHEAEQSPGYDSDDMIPNPYRNSFSCMSNTYPFRPLRKTPKPIVQGSQTAFVVGPAGEEIFTDKYGRVKVQFHWDREGQLDSGSSCWVRVGQAWAGKKWGSMFIPRIGMEVIVDFFEGDPDQPIITGCVYNAEAMPAYKMPDEKTKSGIKTDSSKGGGGFNELRFDDKKGSEEIFIHGEKNLEVRIKEDSKEYIGKDTHLIVVKDKLEKIGGDKHQHLLKDKNEKVDGTVSLDVKQNIQEKVGQNHALDAGTEVHIKAGTNVVVESGTTLTLKVGGNFININSSGVYIKGTMVFINSGGAAGSGAGSKPHPPTDPKEAVKAEAGAKISLAPPSPPPAPAFTFSPAALVMKQAAVSGTPFCDT